MPQLNSGSVLDCQPGAKLSEHLHHPIVLILHPTPEDGGYKEGDNPRGKHCPSLFIPSSRQRTALAALVPQTPPSSPVLSAASTLSSWHIILGVSSPWPPTGIWLCCPSPDSPPAPLHRRLHSPAMHPSSSNLQRLEQFQNIFTDDFLKGHASNSDKPALISSAEQRETD